MAKEKDKSGRRDREGKAAMTTRVQPRVRKIYRVLSAELDATMEELQVIALRSFLDNFRVRSEWQTMWDAVRKKYGDENSATGD